ncbi:hypothetical protein M2360_003421 [Rhizobium sp. SG_E_25_P2]|uniref:DUF930 domain-containing protein n=1 Tax=Rhizobium sp. SG_E_25_P2 TaxID=2879942 RepID=UPI0024742650|nr:DUF930 domain-containing protein [Rhizobium sp. SG_E_25_P2]MDH6268018.1 hypothetical protein [Rhizobium sp. SG_E_25_P2]
MIDVETSPAAQAEAIAASALAVAVIPASRRLNVSLAASSCVHVVIAVLLWRVAVPLPPALQSPIAVALIVETRRPASSSSWADRMGQPATAAPHATPQQRDVLKAIPKPEATPARPAPAAALHPATRLFTASVLADPKNLPARQALQTLATDDRRIQLCNIEAMEQVRRANQFAADTVAPYAMRDIAMQGTVIVAEGAAIRGGGHWRRLRYRCSIDQDAETPSDFSFSLGEEIPQQQWAEHFLAAAAAPSDE